MPEGLAVSDKGARALWPLPRGLAFLNHGGYGLTPKPVLTAQARFKREMERDPARFFDHESLFARLAEARAAAAGALGAAAEDLVFAENTTTGVNTVLQAVALPPGAEILTTDQVYGAVRNALRHRLRTVGGRLVEAALPWPGGTDDEIIAAVEARVTERTALAVFDLIASRSALRLPAERLAGLCRARGIPVLIDAAHAPGQVPLDLPGLGADWVIGNLHKWFFAPRGCAVLWARPGQAAGLHPLSISHFYGGGIAAEFSWTGTRDLTPFLAVPAALAFHRAMGGPGLMARNRALAAEAAAILTEAWGSEAAGLPGQRAAMASVRIPIRRRAAEDDAARRLHDRLLRAHRIQAPVFEIAGALWLRISAQAYNEPAEYRRLADALLAETAALDRRTGSR